VGDALLYDGILCLSGEVASCEAVAKAQGPDGRMWRSAHRVGFEFQNSFSRDMSLGILAYLLATRDAGLATRWMAWLESNRFRTCKVASDNRCDFTPGLWDLFGDVWAHIGLAPHRLMTAGAVDNEFLLPLHARLAPVGYQLHLVAVNLLLRRSMGLESTLTRISASMLVERQPGNPLFQWLHQGNTPEVADLTLRRCPVAAPARRIQWAVERSDEEDAFRASMGWECVALINFMLR